jgi:hypothetical protein
MTQTLASNANNDLIVNSRGNLLIYRDLSAVAADCRSAMQAQRGEMVFAIDRGMPTLETAWNRYQPAQFEAAARKVILRNPDVRAVQSVTVTREREVLRYTAVIQTIYGEARIDAV